MRPAYLDGRGAVPGVARAAAAAAGGRAQPRAPVALARWEGGRGWYWGVQGSGARGTHTGEAFTHAQPPRDRSTHSWRSAAAAPSRGRRARPQRRCRRLGHGGAAVRRRRRCGSSAGGAPRAWRQGTTPTPQMRVRGSAARRAGRCHRCRCAAVVVQLPPPSLMDVWCRACTYCLQFRPSAAAALAFDRDLEREAWQVILSSSLLLSTSCSLFHMQVQ
jgi:hypothetical protein